MPQIRYDLAVQRRAATQVLVQQQPVTHVARQLNCSPQSVRNWIDRHRDTIASHSPSSPRTTFLPLHVEDVPLVPPQIELVTKNGLTLRFSVDTPMDTLLEIVHRLGVAPC